MIATEELESLVSCLSGVSGVLSDLESRVLSLYLDGHSYELIAERLECDTKTVDNALQRVKRKVGTHLASREVAALGGLHRLRQVGKHVRQQFAPVVRGDGYVVGLDSDPVQRLHPQHVAVGAVVGEDPRVGDAEALEVVGDEGGRRLLQRQVDVDRVEAARGGRGGGARRRSPARGRRRGRGR